MTNNFTMMTEEYIKQTIENFDFRIQEVEKAKARCRTAKGVAKREKEIAEIIETKERRIKEYTNRINEVNEAKAKAGTVEYIMPERRDPWSGIRTPMQKFDTIEEIAENERNIFERICVAPIGTYERYKKAQAEIAEIETMLNIR